MASISILVCIKFHLSNSNTDIYVFAYRYNPQVLRGTTTLIENSGFSEMIKELQQRGIDIFG